MIKFVLFASVLFFAFYSTYCQEGKLPLSETEKVKKVSVLGVPQEVLDKIHTFFDSIIANKVEKAFEELIGDSPLKKKNEEIQKLINETKRASMIYGAIKSYEPISSDIVSESFIRVRYLAYHPDFPMRWVFTYYKSPKLGWIVVNIRFDDLSEFFFKED